MPSAFGCALRFSLYLAGVFRVLALWFGFVCGCLLVGLLFGCGRVLLILAGMSGYHRGPRVLSFFFLFVGWELFTVTARSRPIPWVRWLPWISAGLAGAVGWCSTWIFVVPLPRGAYLCVCLLWSTVRVNCDFKPCIERVELLSCHMGVPICCMRVVHDIYVLPCFIYCWSRMSSGIIVTWVRDFLFFQRDAVRDGLIVHLPARA